MDPSTGMPERVRVLIVRSVFGVFGAVIGSLGVWPCREADSEPGLKAVEHPESGRG